MSSAAKVSHRGVLVIGGTRGTGLLIVRRLIGQGTFVRVLARDPARATALFGTTVDIVPGDLTKEHTLPAAVDGVTHLVLTAGRRSGHPARERNIIATEYEGVLHALAAAQRTGFKGRFLYMTSSGTARTSLFSVMLNIYKGHTLKWRRRAEDAIRSSGLAYTIIRAGMLRSRGRGRRLHSGPGSPRGRAGNVRDRLGARKTPGALVRVARAAQTRLHGGRECPTNLTISVSASAQRWCAGGGRRTSRSPHRDGSYFPAAVP